MTVQLRALLEKKPISLTHDIGRGGEGVVYTVSGEPGLVAKIDHVPPPPKKVQKLIYMAGQKTAALSKVAAWPVDVLADTKGTARGFLMPTLRAQRDVHELYSPKSRFEAFPEANFPFLVHVGANIARAFAEVHRHGHVVGDVNHGNLLVAQEGTVMFIDCDSFQVGDGTTLHTCDVGVPLFTPPELQNRPYRGLKRGPDHDAFGLAVLLFHLLFMGRHPYAGRYTGRGEMTIERAIAENRFAYGPDSTSKQMERPPGTVPLNFIGSELSRIFLESFSRNGIRPVAEKWVNALTQLKDALVVCTAASWHHYPKHLATCPWCTVEQATGVRLFGSRISAAPGFETIDIGALWAAIEVVPSPLPDPRLTCEREWRPHKGSIPMAKRLRKYQRAVALVVFLIGLAIWMVWIKPYGFYTVIGSGLLAAVIWPKVSYLEKKQTQEAYLEAKKHWEALIGRWKKEASVIAFEGRRRALEKAKRDLIDLPSERRKGLARLEAQRKDHQLQRYLDRFRIERAKIQHIGSSRTSMLASYGVETAADVTYERVTQIQGIGNVIASSIVSWRRGLEQQFRFNPNEPVDPRLIADLDRELAKKRQILFRELQLGASQLQGIANEIVAARPRLIPQLEKAWDSLKTAERLQAAL